MSNLPGTPNNARGRDDQPFIDVTAKPSMSDLLQRAAPRGFGNYSSEQRYQEIFEDDPQTAPGFGNRANSMGGSYPPPFNGAYSTQQPYEDTILFFRHNKRGVQVSVQATTKMFIILLVIFIALTNSPGIGELINNLLKNVLSAH